MRSLLSRLVRWKKQAGHRPLRPLRFCLETLELRLAPASNLLVLESGLAAQPAKFQIYTPTGSLLSTTNIPSPPSGADYSHDIATDASGNIYVYNGTFNPVLSVYDPSTGTWTNHTFANWNTDAGISDAGLAVLQNYVYATDYQLAGDPPNSDGIVRFDMAAGTAVRFDTGTDYLRVNIGLDGLLYALRNDSVGEVDVYDPSTLALLHTITPPSGSTYEGVAVNAAGDLYLSTYNSKIVELSPTGSVLSTTLLPNEPGLPFVFATFNINVAADGTLVGGGFTYAWTMSPAGNVTYMHTGDWSFGSFATYQTDQASHLAFVQQPPTNNTAGQALTPAVTVAVEDLSGNVVSSDNSTVTLSVASGPGALNGTTVTAQAVNGVATFSNLVLPTAGTYTLEASTASLAAVTSTSFTVSPGPATQFAFEAPPPGGVAGQTLPDVKVDLLDAQGNQTTSTAPVTLSVTGPGNFPVGTTVTVPAVNGVVDFSGLSLQTAGTYTFTVRSPGLTAETSSSFTIGAAVASQLAFGNPPASATAGDAVPTIQVNILDQYGNPTSASGAVTVAVSGPGALTAGTTLVNAVNGSASFGDLVLQTAGTYTLSASAPGLNAPQPVTLAVNPAAPSQLVFPTAPANVAAGQKLPAVAVNLVDAFGNLTASTLPVTIAANGPGNFSAGSFVVAAVNGVATFRGLVLPTAGPYTLTASAAAGVAAATSPTFTVLPAASSRLVFEANPTGAAAGSPLADVKVDIEDALGNLTSSSATLTISVTGPGSFAGGTATVAAVNGVATFHGLSLQAAGSYTYTVAGNGVVPATSAAFQITPGGASQLAFAAPPANGVAGQGLPALGVTILDAFGNVTTSTASVTIAAAGPGRFSAGTTTVAAVNGVATFSGLVLTKAGSYAVTGTASGLAATPAAEIAIQAAPAAQLVLESSPGGTSAGQALADVKVDLLDAYGNPTSSTVPVTLSATGPGDFAAGSTVGVTAVNGVATFHGLALQTAGTYTLTASSPSLTAAVSSTFTISPSAPSQLVFLSPPANGIAGQALADVAVAVLDPYGNQTASSAVVNLALTGPDSFQAGVPLAAAAVDGVAVFHGLVLQKAGTYMLGATAVNLTAAASAGFDVQAAPATQLVFKSNPASGVAGQALSDVNIDLLDPFGNQSDTSSLVSITANGPGTFVAGATTIPALGTGTFHGLTLQQAGTYTVTVSAPGLLSATSGAVTIAAAAASQLAFVAPPVNGIAGQALSDVQMQLLDPYGNPANTTAPLTITANGPSTFSATPTTLTGSIAHFHNVVFQKVGSYTLTVSGPGLTSATSTGFTVNPGAASQLALLTPPTSGTAGQGLADVQVALLDPFGNPTTGNAPVTIAISGPGSLAAGPATVPAVNGVATFHGLALLQAGNYLVSATNPTLQSSPSAGFVISAAAVSQLVVKASSETTTAGQVLPDLPVVALDPYGNPVTGVTVNVSVGGPGAPVSNLATAISAPDGVALFSGLTLSHAGDYALNFNTQGLATVSSAQLFTVVPAAASQLAFEGIVAPTPAGQPLPNLHVDVEDAFGNIVPGAAGAVTLTAAGPAALSPQSATASGGSAVFTGIALSQVGTYTLTASSKGLTAANLNDVSIVAGPVAQLTFAAQPLTVVAGQTMPDVQVKLADAFGNPVNGVPLALTVAGPGTLHAGATAVQAVHGSAVFSGLVLDTAGTYMLSVSAPGVGNLTSSPFQVVPAAAGQLVIAGKPTNVLAGQNLPAVQVDLFDAFGNPIADTVPVSVTVNGPGTLASGSATAKTSGGVATFGDLVLLKAGVYTLSFSSPGLASATSAPFTVATGAASELAFEIAPPGVLVTAGQVLPAIAVDVLDAYGNPTAAAVPLVLSVQGPSAVANLTAPSKNGTADFSGLALPTAGTYTITVSGPNLTSVTSAPFAIAAVAASTPAPAYGSQPSSTPLTTTASAATPTSTAAATVTATPGPAARLRVVAFPAIGHVNKVLPAIKLQVFDAAGKPVATGTLVHVRLVVGHLGGLLQARTDALGTVTFRGLKISKAGKHTLVFTVAGLKTVLRRELTIL